MERALGLSPVAFLVGTVLVYAASICAGKRMLFLVVT